MRSSSALLIVHGCGLQTLGLNRFSVLTGPKHQIGYPVLENCLFPLALVKGV
jgi:hypothetical protein